MDVANEYESFPEMSRTTLAKALKDRGLAYGKRNRNCLLLESPDIVSCSAVRSGHLRYREEDHAVYYFGDAWCKCRENKIKCVAGHNCEVCQ